MSPNAGGGGGVAGSQLYTGAQLNFGDLILYLTYSKCVKTTCPRRSSPPTSGRERPPPHCRQSPGGRTGGWAPASARHRPDLLGHSPHSSTPRGRRKGLTEEEQDIIVIVEVTL